MATAEWKHASSMRYNPPRIALELNPTPHEGSGPRPAKTQDFAVPWPHGPLALQPRDPHEHDPAARDPDACQSWPRP
eukprot:CAMPEP_0204587046 /NCGR_PEP_ID=MMETSP0661-20131031/47836_1 /ASSEMBLY_ACC=CAM_ASM_000606 /TAXON_ID=109239 /ORGANISM="Alexandrium margalefi, Strain AMGDE01CS-322" /LENGTH=76 /DNA_ID=CAMNT_0051596731 /DNA_START=104 /DNA_END=330 /DNA_ORIENTATION=-